LVIGVQRIAHPVADGRAGKRSSGPTHRAELLVQR